MFISPLQLLMPELANEPMPELALASVQERPVALSG